MDIIKLENLRDSLEKMEPIHQERIFEILKNKKIEFTKNINGVFVNMSLFTLNIIEEINNYLLYVRLQQRQLEQGESDKEEYKKLINNTITENAVIRNNDKDNKGNLYLE
jgi:hypothetical protein